MKKRLISVFVLTFALSLPLAAQNYSDDLDTNTVPAPLEERENEVYNSSDALDSNVTPAPFEEREKEEEVESDFIQGYDPEKSYDSLDQEFDE